MANSSKEKQRLIDELSRARAHIIDEALVVRQQCDFGRRASLMWQRYPWAGVGVAGSIGWMFARLPTRKKTVYLHAKPENGYRVIPGKAMENPKTASPVLRHLWSVVKWLLSRYLSRKLFQN
jgi:hypothetical protein